MEYGPDFICIGAQKAGTSWLHWNICFHPEVLMPPEKEISFFSRSGKFTRKLAYQKLFSKKFWKDYIWLCRFPNKNLSSSIFTCCYHRAIWFARYLYAPSTARQYRKLFPKIDGKITGDISPIYTELKEEQIKLFAKAAPNAKIILIIRNPIDRAWSALRMSVPGIDKLPEDEILKMRPFISDYNKVIDLWQRYFPHNFRVFYYDDLKNNPQKHFLSICEYLNILPISQFPCSRINEELHKSLELEMPPKVKTFLAQFCKDEILALHKRLDNEHTKAWLMAVNRVLDESEDVERADAPGLRNKEPSPVC